MIDQFQVLAVILCLGGRTVRMVLMVCSDYTVTFTKSRGVTRNSLIRQSMMNMFISSMTNQDFLAAKNIHYRFRHYCSKPPEVRIIMNGQKGGLT
jgi:hypothetical protein